MRVLKLSKTMCLLVFLEKKDWDLCLDIYVDFLERWLVDIGPWDGSDAARANRCWISFTSIPLFLWHKDFFDTLGSVFSDVLEIGARSLNRKDLRALWLKIDVRIGGKS